MRAASRRSRSACQLTPAARISASRAAGDAQRAALRGGQVGQGQRRGQALAVGLQRLDVAAELVGRRQAGERAQGGAAFVGVGVGEHGLARLGQGVGGVALVDQLEVRREGGFQREAAQQRLAEGVDGADAHAAGQVEHLREQRAGALAEVRRWARWRGRAGRRPGCGSSSVTQRAEGALQPHRHLRGGGLGEGEALDALGLFPGEHQAQQAVGQQLGLARAGRGGDERRHRGVGRRQLLAVGAFAGGHRGSASAPLRGRGRGALREGGVRGQPHGSSKRLPPLPPAPQGEGSLDLVPRSVEPPSCPSSCFLSRGGPLGTRGPTARSRRTAARGRGAAGTGSSGPAGRTRRSARRGCPAPPRRRRRSPPRRP